MHDLGIWNNIELEIGMSYGKEMVVVGVVSFFKTLA